ncbi:O-antigen ligase family protein [Lutibacter sp. B1]|uniref:O-antigen ligase family protein n=1 Tax=Lutibacter sp. B1 TaxID=2725996 RepID=UPI00145675F4|nr:O-antigen ligase family protein [Lutibacter sp. B1]NLP58148.1 O-antigen ligase family protein [Lutibacter sp. B1]
MHLALGIFLLFGSVSKIYSTLIVAFGVLFIVSSKNKNNQAVLWSAYMVGGEVLFRMSGGMFFYELPKYSVLLFLAVGLYVEDRRHHVSVSYLIYILLLLIGISFVDIPFNESIRKAIAFNLSGPVLLGVSAIYFYKRRISINFLLDILFFMVLPIISMLCYLYFKTPNFEEIVFNTNASFVASGGYGPNQVATILGVGVFVFAVHLLLKKRIFWLLMVDLLIFSYIIFRGLITMSRGGMITSLIAIAVFSGFYIISTKDRIKNLVKYIGLISLFGVALWAYTSNVTGGMLTNRYTNKNAVGVTKKDVTTGRVELFKSELDAFFEHPFFGIGVGGSKFYRLEEYSIEAASHNELSRLLGEHGMIGIIILVILIVIPIKNILSQSFLARSFLSAFLIFWFLTINHSAMRIAFPGFIYGLSLIIINFNEENIIHR